MSHPSHRSSRATGQSQQSRESADPTARGQQRQAAYVAEVGQFSHVEAETIVGNSTTGYVKVNTLTTTQRNALTAANGMIIYNSTDSKLQGYQGGAWANLA
tara:strand:- start:499 stop:801 length:303 start_codon:yes stop_codon:yes gene_type:complete